MTTFRKRQIVVDGQGNHFAVITDDGGPTVLGTPCWIWMGSNDGKGYGCVNVEGRQERTHRVTLNYPEELVLHKCRSKMCCRPDHLYLGDHKQNAQDRLDDGTQARFHGAANPAAKLDQSAVADIRSGGSVSDLAERYGITVRTVYKIRSGERWKQDR